MDLVKPTKGLLLSFSNGKAEALFFWCDLLLQIVAMFNRVGQTVPVYAEKGTAPNGRIQPTSDLENWKAPGKKRRKEQRIEYRKSPERDEFSNFSSGIFAETFLS